VTTGFRTYDHLERLGHPDVDGILRGRVHVFPKLDGTNGSVWAGEDGAVRVASRNQELGEGEVDNHGFRAWALGDSPEADALRILALRNPNLAFYGEWLVKHAVRGYRDDAWRRFYVFDAYDRVARAYVAHEEVMVLERGLVQVVPPICVIDDPTEEQVRGLTSECRYLMRDDAPGEGITIKNYGWRNAYGRQPWAKVVREEFLQEKGTPKRDRKASPVEELVVEELVTSAFVEKTRQKTILAEMARQGTTSVEGEERAFEASNRGRIIPQLLGRAFHDLVIEESWTIVKEHREPVVDFARLRRLTEAKVKELAKDLFEGG